ncbi:MAG: protein translocase subunit SecD, partial [Demequina sp.]
FTHPLMVLLARTKFFGEGHKWSGLDPRQLGREVLYKGRGRVRSGDAVSSDGLTLAERKAAARRGQTPGATVAAEPTTAAGSTAAEPSSGTEPKGGSR